MVTRGVGRREVFKIKHGNQSSYTRCVFCSGTSVSISFHDYQFLGSSTTLTLDLITMFLFQVPFFSNHAVSAYLMYHTFSALFSIACVKLGGIFFTRPQDSPTKTKGD